MTYQRYTCRRTRTTRRAGAQPSHSDRRAGTGHHDADVVPTDQRFADAGVRRFGGVVPHRSRPDGADGGRPRGDPAGRRILAAEAGHGHDDGVALRPGHRVDGPEAERNIQQPGIVLVARDRGDDRAVRNGEAGLAHAVRHGVGLLHDGEDEHGTAKEIERLPDTIQSALYGSRVGHDHPPHVGGQADGAALRGHLGQLHRPGQQSAPHPPGDHTAGEQAEDDRPVPALAVRMAARVLPLRRSSWWTKAARLRRIEFGGKRDQKDGCDGEYRADEKENHDDDDVIFI